MNWLILLSVLALGCNDEGSDLASAPSETITGAIRTEQIDLGHRLAYAGVSGTPPTLLPTQAGEQTRFKQFADSTIRFGALLPGQAHLRGRLSHAEPDSRIEEPY